MSSVGEVKTKVLVGRQAVDVYRTAHIALHNKPYYRQVHADHTPLLEAMVNALEAEGFSSAQTDFEDKKTEVLAKFWNDSDLVNVQELGFSSREDFDAELSKLNIGAERVLKIDEDTGEPYEIVIDTPEARALREALRAKWS